MEPLQAQGRAMPSINLCCSIVTRRATLEAEAEAEAEDAALAFPHPASKCARDLVRAFRLTAPAAVAAASRNGTAPAGALAHPPPEADEAAAAAAGSAAGRSEVGAEGGRP